MLVDLSIMPLGEARTGAAIAEALDLIAESGLPYRLTPSGICIEGGWDDVIPVVRGCHAVVARRSPHLVTLLRIEEDGSERGMLDRNIASVTERAGQPATSGGADDLPGIHV